MNRQRDAKAFLAKHGLTLPQMEILRHAARKYTNLVEPLYSDGRPRQLHNGAVQTFNIRTETQSKLRDGGWIHYTHTVDDPDERGRIETKRINLVETAWRMAKSNSPNVLVSAIEDEGGAKLPAWKEVHCTLSIAKTLENSLFHKSWKITDKGRKVVADFKKLIGAEEE